MIKLFTHTDFDGIGCAILAKIAFGNDVDISFCNYDDIDEVVSKFIAESNDYEMCHITDISITNELANEINEKHTNFYLLDHHPTALHLNDYIWCNVIIENEHNHIKTSGTELYYHWLADNGYINRNNALDDFVEIVRDYDTWRWTTLGDKGIFCKRVNDLLYLYGRNKFVDWCLSKLNLENPIYFNESDKLVLEIEQNNIDSYIKKKNEQMTVVSLCGKACGVVFAEKYFSELGNKLCQMNPEIDFVAMIDMNGTVSYRTIKDDIDLGKDIAKLFGGGGHPKAAGSRFNNDISMEVFKSIFGRNVEFAS